MKPAACLGIVLSMALQAAPARAEQTPPANTTCPVMKGNPVDPDRFTLYRGRKVYFCCATCQSKFEKDPAKYFANLPQFAPAGGEEHATGHAHDEPGHGRITPASLIEPMGIVTLSLVAATVCLGLARRSRRLGPRAMLRWHKRLGIAALAAGVVHATLVILAH